MLNKVWFWLLLVGILYGFGKGAWQSWSAPALPPAAEQGTEQENNAKDKLAATPPETGLAAMGRQLNKATLDAATASVEICITLIGIMALWLGLLNIAKDAGLVDAFARLLRPLMRWLFPEIPDGHPAQGAILMNLSANMLGLDNAATPMGLKAMRELQELNPVKDTATDSMVMFLAINTSSITLVPFTIIGYRVASGSVDPARPMVAILMATTVSTVVAIVATRWLSRWPRFRVAAQTGDGNFDPGVRPKEGTA
ncbi:MAG: nucleoside recognition domain-containing protein [Pirellulales bacterium]